VITVTSYRSGFLVLLLLSFLISIADYSYTGPLLRFEQNTGSFGTAANKTISCMLNKNIFIVTIIIITITSYCW